jgi:hypothetical protein
LEDTLLKDFNIFRFFQVEIFIKEKKESPKILSLYFYFVVVLLVNIYSCLLKKCGVNFRLKMLSFLKILKTTKLHTKIMQNYVLRHTNF